ncbi:MAG: restriction endonuclease subunit S [Chlorobiales bacterium]|nr:restriction endonuclease subunit S [Chlorobiales bacterium]
MNYPTYKDSCIPWLGKVPEHWIVLNLSKCVKDIKDGTHGTFERIPSEFFLLSAKNVSDKGVAVGDNESSISEEDYRAIVANGFPRKNDVLVTIVGTIGRTCVYDIDKPIAFQRSVAFLRLNKNHEPRFFTYQIRSKPFQDQLLIRTKSAAQGGVYMGDLVQIQVLSTNLPEQNAIADFLDRETGRIDELIEKKKRLIGLLKEKRSAMISRTVTRGLPADAAREFGLEPHTRFKDSGIEWLGDVPEGWEVKRLSYLALLKSGESITSEQIAEGGRCPVYGGNGMRGYFSEYTHEGLFVLIGRQGALCGNINYASGRFWASEHAIVVHPLKRFAVKWLGELLRAMNLNQYSISAAQPGLSVSQIGALKIPVPPYQEQTAIATYLDHETAKIDKLMSKVEEAIERLQEYRMALITAAVTGKIDVLYAVDSAGPLGLAAEEAGTYG